MTQTLTSLHPLKFDYGGGGNGQFKDKKIRGKSQKSSALGLKPSVAFVF